MTDRRRIEYTTDMDSRGFERGTERVTGGLRKVAQFAAAAFAADRVIDFVGQSLQLASAAEEIDSKFEAVFGTARDLERRLSDLGDMAGITDADIKGLAATFGNLAQTQGITGEAAEDLTFEVAQLAADLGSFNDQDPARVFENLTKAILTTEREGLKPLGIAVTENEVKQRALAIAVADGREEVTKADRALASYNIIVEQSGKAIGDLERTQDSAANQQRQLTATFEELKTEIGAELLPVMVNLLSIANDLTPVLKGLTVGVGGAISPIADLTAAVDEADQEGKRWWQTLGDLTVAAYRWVPGLGQIITLTEEATRMTDGASKSFERNRRNIHEASGAYYIIANEIANARNEIAATTTVLQTHNGIVTQAQREWGELARKIIAAKLEYLELRDLLGSGGGGGNPPLPGPL